MEQLANRIAVFFAQKNLITTEETPVYSYCFEVVLSMIVSWGSILMIAMLTNTLWVTACYIGSFCLLRSVVGGYHASTHLRCYLLSVGAYLLFLLVQFCLPTQYVNIGLVIVQEHFYPALLWCGKFSRGLQRIVQTTGYNQSEIIL